MVHASDLPQGVDPQLVPISIRTAANPEYRYMQVVFYNERGEFLREGVIDQAILDNLSQHLPLDETVYMIRIIEATPKQRAKLGPELDRNVEPTLMEELFQYFVRRGFIGALNHQRRYGKKSTIERSGCTFRVIQPTS